MVTNLEARIRNVTAVLGPTNTGKTHLAIERMLGHETGMIGLPLRLLAREVYDKIVARVGAEKVALITGEEKIRPERARYWVSTVEAMPREVEVEFLAIDEIQLAADPERGHVFTDRLLHARGRSETLLLGAQTMRDAISDLIPGANFISRPRLSRLSYVGEKKITRLPARSAVVAFSAAEVYSIAELIRRQRGGAAVVLGALSPRTRNAQVGLYQSGDVDFLIATDAIGMGLNLDVDHVAFSGLRKFDGQNHRNLTPGEIGQIAGRAGRHMNDGTFGVTGSAEALDAELVERLETHAFDNVRTLQWRNRDLDFATLDRLHESLREHPREGRLTRARVADDLAALDAVSSDREIAAHASSPAAVMKLWDVCQVPDYRKISGQNHAELVATLYKFLMGPEGRIPEDWFAKQVAFADRTDGDIDTLSNRLAHIRTWTFVSNRSDWLKDPEHWQDRTRAIEDSLSDALHERLTQRFVDRRTSALMKGMRDKDELTAEIGEDGAIHVENHFVGRLNGFRFSPDAQAEGIHGKAARHAASQVLSRELQMRTRRVVAAGADAFKLTRTGRIVWKDEEIAQLEASDDALKPSVSLLVDEHLSVADREKVQVRLDTWVQETVAEKLKPLVDIGKAEDISGLARGIAFRLRESFGALKRETVAEEIKALDQNARAQLRRYGVRFGAFNIFFPQLLKPAPADLLLTLWALHSAASQGLAIDSLPEPPRGGLTSVTANPDLPEAYYRVSGFHVCGPRAVRLDILERLADLIRPLLAWRPNPEAPTPPPKGATGEGAFMVTPDMMSILGCSPEELGTVLKALGFRLERRPVRESAPAPQAEAAPTEAAPGAEPSSEASAPAPAAEAVETPAAMSTDDQPAEVTAEAAAQPEGKPAKEEPKFEELWRPKRHNRNEHRRRGGRQGDRNRPAAARQEGAPADAAASGSPAAEAKQDASGDRAPRQADRQRDENRNGRQGDRNDRRREGQRGPRNRDNRRNNERRGPEIHTASAPRKPGGIDPTSPFAALSALREQLERRAKDPGT